MQQKMKFKVKREETQLVYQFIGIFLVDQKKEMNMQKRVLRPQTKTKV